MFNTEHNGSVGVILIGHVFPLPVLTFWQVWRRPECHSSIEKLYGLFTYHVFCQLKQQAHTNSQHLHHSSSFNKIFDNSFCSCFLVCRCLLKKQFFFFFFNLGQLWLIAECCHFITMSCLTSVFNEVAPLLSFLWLVSHISANSL